MGLEMATDRVISLKALKIASSLHGLPMRQALTALDEARQMLLNSHLVDTNSKRFTGLMQEFVNGYWEED